MDNNISISFLLTFIAGISTCFGIIFTFIKVKRVEEFIVFSLGLSLSVMLSICIFDLMPNSLMNLYVNNLSIKTVFIVIFAFIAGIITIDFINKRVDNNKKNNNNNLCNLGILSLLAIFMHNLPEGVATFMSSYSDIKLGIILSFGIMIHNIPEGITIALPLFYCGIKRARVFLYTFIAGFAELVGAILTYFFLQNFINVYIISIVLIYVSGLMICLSINYIFKEALEYKKNKQLLIGIISGVIVYILSSVILKVIIT